MAVYNKYIDTIKACMNGDLPGWTEQKKYLPHTTIPGVSYTSNNKLRKGAVLACLYEDSGTLMTILIERTQDTSPHSGQIAFPGGKYENQDKTQIETAIREAEEEIGINKHDVEIIGSLSSVDIPVSGFTVLPVIGYYDGIPQLHPNPHEVNSIIQTPLIPLIKSLETRVITVRQHKVKTPVFSSNGHIIWGATAMVLGELKAILNA
ncbi:MAG: CoA pyrophosphatase [Bacteroidota bacterium]|nr:CoA pyrophosphatase [Bacteroidota bacterium]